MAASRDGRWAVATNMVRFDSDLMLLDNFDDHSDFSARAGPRQVSVLPTQAQT